MAAKKKTTKKKAGGGPRRLPEDVPKSPDTSKAAQVPLEEWSDAVYLSKMEELVDNEAQLDRMREKHKADTKKSRDKVAEQAQKCRDMHLAILEQKAARANP